MVILGARGAMNSTTSDDTNGDMLYHKVHFILLVIFSGFAITAVILRLWARKIQKQACGLPDYLIVLGLVRIWENFTSLVSFTDDG